MTPPATVPTSTDPRVERTRRVVVDAAVALLSEGGYAAVTIEAVAARSGVAKSTIYRHWPNSIELVRDAFHQLKPPLTACMEGTARERIVTLLEHLATSVQSSTWSSCLPTLIDAAERDPEARALHRMLCTNGRQVLIDVVAEGIASGELPPGIDPTLVAEALSGPILLRRLMVFDPFDPADVRQLVDLILPEQ